MDLTRASLCLTLRERFRLAVPHHLRPGLLATTPGTRQWQHRGLPRRSKLMDLTRASLCLTLRKRFRLTVPQAQHRRTTWT